MKEIEIRKVMSERSVAAVLRRLCEPATGEIASMNSAPDFKNRIFGVVVPEEPCVQLIAAAYLSFVVHGEKRLIVIQDRTGKIGDNWEIILFVSGM